MQSVRENARSLFEQGQIHYSLGEYDQAIVHFRQAYELSSAPALLFNIAQAYRLKGQCSQALEIYHHFIRLDTDSQQISEAEVQIEALKKRCPSNPAPPDNKAQAAPAPKASDARSTLSVDGGHQRTVHGTSRATRRRGAKVLLATGVMIGVGTGLLYWWNDSRHDRWSTEDRLLASSPNANRTPSIWIARQNGNDALLRSIWQVDTAVGALAALTAVCVLGSATLGILPEEGAQLTLGPSEIRLAWRLYWP